MPGRKEFKILQNGARSEPIEHRSVLNCLTTIYSYLVSTVQKHVHDKFFDMTRFFFRKQLVIGDLYNPDSNYFFYLKKQNHLIINLNSREI